MSIILWFWMLLSLQLKNSVVPFKSRYLLKYASIILWFWMMFPLQLKNNGTPLKPRYLQKCMLIILWFRMFPLQLYNNGTPLKPRYLLRYMSIILLFWMMISPEFCHESLALVAGHERCLYQRTLRWELAWRCPALVFTLRPTAPQNKTKMWTILFKLSWQNDAACLKRKQLQ